MEKVEIQDLVDFVEEHGGSMGGEKRDRFINMLIDWRGVPSNFGNTDEQIMDGVFENLWVSSSPWVIQYGYGGYDEDKEVLVDYYDADDTPQKKAVNAEMLHKAHAILIEQGYKHCGQKLETDCQEWDACGSDMVLQQAIFDEVIYG